MPTEWRTSNYIRSQRGRLTTSGKMFTPIHRCHEAVQFGTGQSAVILCKRDGERGPDYRRATGLFIYLPWHRTHSTIKAIEDNKNS